ncbi:hypothetical protein YC2023_084897 [Brassica napus]
MSSRLDLPSASPTRSTAASAIPVTHTSSSRYSCSEDLHRMPLLRPSQSLPSSIVSGILKACVVGIPSFTRLSGLKSRFSSGFPRRSVGFQPLAPVSIHLHRSTFPSPHHPSPLSAYLPGTPRLRYVSCTSLSLMDALGSAEDPVLQVPSMAELNYTQGACAVSSIASGWISATTPNGGRTNNLCHSYGLS